MKIFDFSAGRKGEELGSIKRANSQGGFIVEKDGRTYRIELANAPEGWGWHDGATWLRWDDGEPVEDVQITPGEFGVEAICFSTGEYHGVWQWTVLGTREWNRKACQNGILKYTLC